MSTSRLLYAAYARNLQRIKWDQLLERTSQPALPIQRVPSLLRRPQPAPPRLDEPGSTAGFEDLLAAARAGRAERIRAGPAAA
jgi:hypothetical protein